MKAPDHYLIWLLPAIFFCCLSCTSGNENSQGYQLYQSFCANCHMENGQGLQGLIPPLTDTAFFRQNEDRLPCIIKYGMDEEIEIHGMIYNEPMAGIPSLTDAEIANILNYLSKAHGHSLKYKSDRDIDQALNECE